MRGFRQGYMDGDDESTIVVSKGGSLQLLNAASWWSGVLEDGAWIRDLAEG